MNKLKEQLRRVPLIRWLDDWSDTPTGETTCCAIICAFIMMMVVYKAIPSR